MRLLHWIGDLVSFVTAPTGYDRPLDLPLVEEELDGLSTSNLRMILSDSRLPPGDIQRYLKTVRSIKKKKR
jgi:hypothetical protein